MIAGHTFIDTPHGRVCDCGRAWVQIAGASEADIGKPGIAHYGDLNAQECKEIHDEVTRIWQTVWDVAKAPA